jgi:hypothetical protein
VGLADRETVRGIFEGNFHKPSLQHSSAVVYVIDFKNCLPLLHSHAPHGRIYEYALVCVQVGGLELVYYAQWNYHLQRQRKKSHYKLVHVTIVTRYTCLKPLIETNPKRHFVNKYSWY